MTQGVLDIFIDTEFSDNGGRIIPISIGAVCETTLGPQEWYVEIDHDPNDLDPWVQANVLPKLLIAPDDRISSHGAAKSLERWVHRVSAGSKPRFWAYYPSHDWVLICQLYGGLMKLPKHWDWNVIDLRVWFNMLGRPEGCEPPKADGSHNALDDAKWNLQFFHNIGTKMGFPEWQ